MMGLYTGVATPQVTFGMVYRGLELPDQQSLPN